MPGLLDLPFTALDGHVSTLRELTAGRAALVVNVASKCGLTPQYVTLQKLYDERHDDIVVIGFPCNQFMEQEPGDAEEIREFCSANYGVTFPLGAKIEVNGPENGHLYRELLEHPDSEGYRGDIRWNFEKFVLDRDGGVVARFGPATEPDAADLRTALDRATGPTAAGLTTQQGDVRL